LEPNLDAMVTAAVPTPSYRIAVKESTVAISTVEDGGSVFAYDRAGRLFAAWVGQRLYRRGLDNRLVEKQTVHAGGLSSPIRRVLDEAEKAAFLDAAAQTAAADALARGQAEILWATPSLPSLEGTQRLITAAASFDSRAARRDASQFATAYRPVGILPPDQYLALVLQITEGCHWNRCTFCRFYRQVLFHVKSIPELELHVDVAVQYFGAGRSMRRALFLGEANALVLPTDDLLARLDLASRRLAAHGYRFTGIYSFLDIFTGRHKSVDKFAALRDQGLRRVYVGVETGDDTLLTFLHKPQQAADAAALVQTVKAAGLSVGVIVMAGIGGDTFAESHVCHTVRLLNSLPLAQSDLIYLSAFVDAPDSEYAAEARARGIRALTPREVSNQMHAIREGLRFTAPAGPRVARYDIEEFIY
jgi:hypothetical protein